MLLNIPCVWSWDVGDCILYCDKRNKKWPRKTRTKL